MEWQYHDEKRKYEAETSIWKNSWKQIHKFDFKRLI